MSRRITTRALLLAGVLALASVTTPIATAQQRRTPPPSTPSLVAGLSGTNTARLGWSTTSNTTSYSIYASANGGASWRLVSNVSAGQRSYEMGNLARGATVFFQVQANGPGGSVRSNTRAVSVPAPPAEDFVTAAGANVAATIDSFNVQTNGAYLPANGNTYCNKFVAHVTSRLGKPIPLYLTDSRGNITVWLTANAMYDWLLGTGRASGWREVSARQAQQLANQGLTVVASWKNPTGGHGHIAMVRAFAWSGRYSDTAGPAIAQAGARNYASTTVSVGFGSSRVGQVRYFAR